MPKRLYHDFINLSVFNILRIFELN